MNSNKLHIPEHARYKLPAIHCAETEPNSISCWNLVYLLCCHMLHVACIDIDTILGAESQQNG